jgi:hypothetical protein
VRVGDTLPLNFSPGASNGILKFGFGDDAIAEPVLSTLTPSKLTTGEKTIRQMRLNVRTGIFSGSLLLDNNPSSFSGALFQRQNMASGVLLSPEGAGWVSLVGATPAAAVQGGGLQLNSGTLRLSTSPD